MPPANPALDSTFTAQVDADDKNPLLLTNLTLILVALIVNCVLPPEFTVTVLFSWTRVCWCDPDSKKKPGFIPNKRYLSLG
jgi:hypothetical protein